MSDDVDIGDEWTTYKRADGELIAGEFGWVAHLEYFDDDDRPTELIEERWCLVRRKAIVVNPDDIEIELAP